MCDCLYIKCVCELDLCLGVCAALAVHVRCETAQCVCVYVCGSLCPPMCPYTQCVYACVPSEAL